MQRKESKSTSKETKNLSSELREEKIGKLINSPFKLYKQHHVKTNENKSRFIDVYLFLLERNCRSVKYTNGSTSQGIWSI